MRFVKFYDILWGTKTWENQWKTSDFQQSLRETFFFRFFVLRCLKNHENEDHVWAKKQKGKPKENQWFSKIAHKRKWKKSKKDSFSRGAHSSKML